MILNIWLLPLQNGAMYSVYDTTIEKERNFVTIYIFVFVIEIPARHYIEYYRQITIINFRLIHSKKRMYDEVTLVF